MSIDFLDTIEILNSSIDRIYKGYIQDGINEIKMIISHLEYVSKYVPGLEIPDGIINAVNTKLQTDPLLEEIVMEFDSYMSLKTSIDGLIKETMDETVEDMFEAQARLHEVYKESIHLSREDFIKHIKNHHNNEISEMKRKLDDHYHKITQIFLENPELTDKLQDRLDEIRKLHEDDVFKEYLSYTMKLDTSIQENPE